MLISLLVLLPFSLTRTANNHNLFLAALTPDLCKICVANTIVFPAWESMENRLQNPTTYYVFYHNFLRAAVGEEDWKIAASTRTTATPTVANPTPRMSTSLNEAFALVLFKNNYFAWLLHAKQEYPGLVSDYDSDRGEATSSLAEFLLGGVVIDLDDDKRDQHFLLMPAKTLQPADLSPNDASALLVRAHQTATEQLKYTTQVLQASVRASVSYLQIQEAILRLQEQEQPAQEQGLAHLRKRKKRKLLKELKPYTARQGSEKAFRGWSKRAFTDLFNYKTAIEADHARGLYAKFEQGYKQLYALQHAYKKNAATIVEDQPIMVMEDSVYEQLFDFSAVLPGGGSFTTTT